MNAALEFWKENALSVVVLEKVTRSIAESVVNSERIVMVALEYLTWEPHVLITISINAAITLTFGEKVNNWKNTWFCLIFAFIVYCNYI